MGSKSSRFAASDVYAADSGDGDRAADHGESQRHGDHQLFM